MANEIGQIIREWRGDRTQVDVAKELDIPQSHLSRLERGLRFPGKQLALVLAKKTNKPLEIFIKAS